MVKGVPLRVQWGRPKPLDNMDRDARMENARAGRSAQGPSKSVGGPQASRAITAGPAGGAAAAATDDLDSLIGVAAPPGQDDKQYAAQSGE